MALSCYRHDCKDNHDSSSHSNLAPAAETLTDSFENLPSMLMGEYGHKLQQNATV